MTNPTVDASQALPARKIRLLTASAIAAGAVILLVAVLPAEFGRDPTGLGKATGLAALWAPPEQKVAATTEGKAPAARFYDSPFRTDVVEIPLGTYESASNRGELEYKVEMKKGATLAYSWEVRDIANPEEFYTDFHGHTVEDGKTMTVAEYKQATGTSDRGALIAPFDGVHGWFFQNQSVKPVVIRVKMSGFYTLIPPGKVGNEQGIVAKPIE